MTIDPLFEIPVSGGSALVSTEKGASEGEFLMPERDRPTPSAAGGVAALAVLLTLGIAGCPKAPSLKFSAIPPFICKGQTTNLSWETDANNATIVAEPATAVSLGQVSARESRPIELSSTTIFTITAANGGKTSTARAEVSVVDTGGGVQRVQLEPKGWEGAAIYETDLPANNWPAIVRAGNVTLTAALPFDLVVEHEGKSATLAKGTTTTADLAGTPFAGHYRGVLKAPTKDDALDAIVLPISVGCSP